MQLPPLSTPTQGVTLGDLRVLVRQGDAPLAPASALLSERAVFGRAERVLLLGGGPALAALVARQCALTVVDIDVVSLALVAQTLQRNGGHAHLSDGGDLAAGGFDAALMALPHSRKLARRWLLLAHAALREGGALTLAGPNDGGIRSVVDDAAALFGAAQPLGSKRHCRIAGALKRATGPRPNWAAEPGIAPGTWRTFTAETPAGPLALLTQAGVFSFDGLDAGTALLLAHLPDVAGKQVLDVGCGAGVLGISAALCGAAHVDMTDVSLPAIAATAQNIARHCPGNAAALPGDVLSAVQARRYDVILSNPPFHSGSAVDYDVAHAIIAQSAAALHPGGTLRIVANRFLPYDAAMRPLFASVARVAQTGRYHVLEGKRASDAPPAAG